MRILKSPRSKRVMLALAMFVASLSVVTVGGLVAAPMASAASCNTLGHAYVTAPGRSALTSGFEGDQRNGLPTWTYTQGWESFRLGGNGISPGSFIDFFAFDANTGQQVGFVPGRPAQYPTRAARSNCVVNEEGPYTFTLPPGTYKIVANYFPGNNFRLVTDTLGFLTVQAPPPPPPPIDDPPWNPCGPEMILCF
ncbi:MAG TPA: hypothetical protein VHM23_20825 [Actinomycetota bacterium]|jgi:hypothetical protein|nr:hypothetical protein [Actinomycetota bacterium]